MAPKVEETMYGPIKADRWSCRRVLLYILDELRKEDEHLKLVITVHPVFFRDLQENAC